MHVKHQKQAFTLIEILIATTIFAMLAVMASQVQINISKMGRKIEIQEYISGEADIAINRIVREVERGTVDYEEYFSRLVLADLNYGQNYGAYGATFYDPGTDGPISGLEGGDGICCDTGCGTEFFFTETSCDDMDIDTYDSDTGTHPYDGVGVEDYNAFCENEGDCDSLERGFQDELYLINGSGTRKVVFALENKEGGSEYAISMVVMEGIDVDGDNISDYWRCSSDYTCTGVSDEGYAIPNPDDLTNESMYDDDFEPITPNSMNVLSMAFVIAPFEDPYRSFAETSQSVQQHPSVTVMIDFTAGESSTAGLLGENWVVSLQQKAAAIVFGEVPSEYKGSWRWE